MAVKSTGLLTKGLRSEFFKIFEATPSNFGRWSTRIPSNADSETYKHLGQVPVMREWGTGRKAQGLNVETYTVSNLKYESTLEVDRDEISDDQTGQIRIRVQEMAQRAATHKDYLISQLLINGSTAGFLSSDGVPFFDASHTWGSSGTQANEANFDISAHVATNGEPDDVNQVGPATAAAGVSYAIGQLMLFKDDRGEPMNFTSTGLEIVCHPQQYISFLTAVSAAMLNQSNTVIPKFGITVTPLPWLTDVSQWYLLKTDSVLRPFIFQDREPVEFKSQAEDSVEEFLREKYLYGVRARYRLTYGRWQHAFAVNFTT